MCKRWVGDGGLLDPWRSNWVEFGGRWLEEEDGPSLYLGLERRWKGARGVIDR